MPSQASPSKDGTGRSVGCPVRASKSVGVTQGYKHLPVLQNGVSDRLRAPVSHPSNKILIILRWDGCSESGMYSFDIR